MHPGVASPAQQDDVAQGVRAAGRPGHLVVVLQGGLEVSLAAALGALALIPDGNLGLDVLRDIPGHTATPAGVLLGHDIIIIEAKERVKKKWLR